MDLILNNFIVDATPKFEQITNNKQVQDDVVAVGKKNREFNITSSKSQPVKALVARKKRACQQAVNVVTEPENPVPEKRKPKVQKPLPKLSQETPAPRLRRVPLDKNNQRKTKIPEKNAKTGLHNTELLPAQSSQEKLFSDQSLDSLNIHPHSKKNVKDLLHYNQLTMVQSIAIPQLLEGKDALIRAQTGSGKTFAYALPLIEQLHAIRPKIVRSDGILAVVIVPTRELAVQTYEIMVKLTKPYTWIVPGYLCGGEKRKSEKAKLRAGLNILVGTPGRFCDHIRNTKTLLLGNVRWLILDEADRLLELGYEENVKDIVSAIQNAHTEGSNGERNHVQTVLLSATLTSTVKELAGLTLHDPVVIDMNETTESTAVSNCAVSDQAVDLNEDISIPSTVMQFYVLIPPKLRFVALVGLIAREQHVKPSRILVFLATQDLVDFHYDVLVEICTVRKQENMTNYSQEEYDNVMTEYDSGVTMPRIGFFKLHGRMTQTERSAVFQNFRKAPSGVLLCTDVVARGIDIPSVDLVVQYNAPHVLTDYVHRVGRTARAGATGRAILFVEPAETDFVTYLSSKCIRIQELQTKNIFKFLEMLFKKAKPGTGNDGGAELDYKLQRLVKNESQLHESACKAFASWVRYYTNFPKDLRKVFSLHTVHMGHHAKSFGLNEPPTQFMKNHIGSKQGKGLKRLQRTGSATNKGTILKIKEKGTTRRLLQRNSQKIAHRMELNISEFNSGLPPMRIKSKRS